MTILNLSTAVTVQEAINIGRRGTYGVLTVNLDFSVWAAEYGPGVVSLYVKRNRDDAAYPVVLSVDGSIASWIVSEVDTNVVGYGTAEFMYTADSQLQKSAVFSFVVEKDIGQPVSDPPDPYESWLETLGELGVQTQTNAQIAHDSAQAAAQSKGNARQSEETARQKAEEAVQAAEAARESEINAAKSADKAEQAAGQAGYMYFYIDENGDLIYKRTPNTTVDFYLQDGNLYVKAVA